ncbi:MAG: hypothetical protein EXR85_03605 [Xanthomonadales bacterium]|nr:hypothetical protein [Xanthomonadales bacterium]
MKPLHIKSVHLHFCHPSIAASRFRLALVSGRCLTLLLLPLLWAATLQAADWRVCPTGSEDSSCNLRGYPGIQQAVEQAGAGDRVTIAAGVYSPAEFRDVPYGELVIRGGVLVEGKTLQLRGEPGAVLDGSSGPAVCALLVYNSTVEISGLEIRDFKVGLADDDLYDGHGIFIIDSKVTVQDTQMNSIAKMAVSVFGDSRVVLSRLRVQNGHVGIWVEGNSTVRVENSLFSNNSSAAVAAYDHSSTEIYNSVVEASLDDGVFGKGNAIIVLVNSILVGNQPYAVRAEELATISVDYCAFDGNQSLFFPETAGGQLTAGDHVYLENLQLDMDFRPGKNFQPSRGDPAIRNRDGTVSDIGLFGGPAAPGT